MRRVAIVAGVIALAAAVAPAREPDGQLGIVVAPNNAQPALVQPGQSFEVLLRAQASIRLESGEGVFELETGRGVLWRGWVRVACRVPEGASPGMYTLVAESRNSTDRAFRAVHVYDTFPETYRVAQLNDLRVGAEDGLDTMLYRSTRRINAGDAALVLVTGNLTAHGAAEEFRVALEVLNDLAAPTLVVPGAIDRSGRVAEAYLGPYPVTRSYGRDGYMAYFTPAEPPGWIEGGSGRLYTARRSIQASRWSVGLSNRYELGPALRDALTLFVDDPLDIVIVGDAGSLGGLGGKVHWGRTGLYGPATTSRGGVRWYEAGPQSILPVPTNDTVSAAPTPVR